MSYFCCLQHCYCWKFEIINWHITTKVWQISNFWMTCDYFYALFWQILVVGDVKYILPSVLLKITDRATGGARILVYYWKNTLFSIWGLHRSPEHIFLQILLKHLFCHFHLEGFAFVTVRKWFNAAGMSIFAKKTRKTFEILSGRENKMQSHTMTFNLHMQK